MRRIFLLAFLILSIQTKAQLLQNKSSFTLDDTLRGTITPERSWWDLQFYHLKVAVKPEDKTISGSTVVRYKVLSVGKMLQIDLQAPLQIQQIIQDGEQLSFEKKGKNAYFVSLKKEQIIDQTHEIEVFYSGKPQVAKRAPWDGGFSWSKDKNGDYFIATSCQGLGSSIWWPCKDHMYDEPDSMAISVNVPKAYTDVSNGVLRSVIENKDETRTFNWYVSNPINNYGVNINIAKYEHFEEEYAGEKGKLAVNYYVLPENLEKAKDQFKQVPMMLKAFENWFGPYPFYEDGFKLVEVPYLGMEHQSSVTYGNKYKNGYLGRDLSNSGWGLKWDFIIIHESGHEWFANNITYKDVADMWIHEGFTAYSETLFTEYYFGKAAATAYVTGTRANIKNDSPIIGTYGVNKEGSGDMYYKGANMIHSIRQYAKSDEDFRQILRGLNKEFYHQTVDSKQIEDYLSKGLGKDLSKIFDQFLRDKRMPVLEYKLEKNKIKYRWNNCITDFEMPIVIKANNQNLQIEPTTSWKNLKFKKPQSLEIDINYLAKSVEVK